MIRRAILQGKGPENAKLEFINDLEDQEGQDAVEFANSDPQKLVQIVMDNILAKYGDKVDVLKESKKLLTASEYVSYEMKQ